MPKSWKRVTFDASAEDTGQTIIRITKGRQGDTMASVERLQWHEPDGHEHTGFAAGSETGRRPAAQVIADYKKLSAQIALESDDLWDTSWGILI